MIKIILREDIKSLGKRGEIFNVRDGYVRNFLIPRGLAYEATDANVRSFEQHKRLEEVRLTSEKKNAERLANKLMNVSCTVIMNATSDDKLFGAVTAKDIAAALEQQGNILIDRKLICLDSPIKELGVFHVPVKLHPEFTQTIKVWVVKK
ncbi:MAG: 50S ribosomal protein L9 [Candidatus Omnitrophota bacterium]